MGEINYTPNDKLRRVSEVDAMALPESYRTNSAKEELMLEYVENFVRQFSDLYAGRKQLLLCPRNECGIRKFICTTLRPTQLPYPELYDYDKCAKFVADFITYEPLDLTTALPSHVPSPEKTLEWQAGDCFDVAQVLCSLLLGVGYDAYVVCGYAPRAVTQADLSGTILAVDNGGAVQEEKKEAVASKYAVPPRRVLESQFQKQRAARKAAEEAAKLKGTSSTVANEMGDADEAEEMDEAKGRRVHAWVLMLAGKRMLEQSLFIEPSTGATYPLDSAPYYGIESLWNASNYWVSMQGELPVSKLSYDLTSNKKWEFVLLDTTTAMFDEGDEDGLQNAEKPAVDKESDADATGGVEKVFIDMPPTWVSRLNIEREKYQARCPSGEKETQYRKSRLEKFAPYSREDGLVERLTECVDIELKVASKVTETYANRKDKLSTRIVRPARNGVPKETVEKFDPGRPRGLKQLIEVEGKRREFHFYSSSRLDGLMSRVEDFGVKTAHTYEGSRDTLVYRAASYVADGEDGQIRKMMERYKRTPEVDAEQDVAKRTFDLSPDQQMIKVRYHYGPDRVTASWRTYSKGGHTVVQVDPFSRPPTDAVMLDEFQRLQAAERECLNQMRESDRQAKEMLSKRQDEETLIYEAMAESAADMGDRPALPAHLLVSVYDTARSKLAAQPESSDEADREKVPHDYLTSFLPRPLARDDPPLSREESLQARDACLKSLKDRLVERANIVQSRLDEENAALSKRQAAFQRNRDHMEASDEAEYERYCQEAMFRIQILEQRLDRHTELSLHKYAEMDARLRNDSRLAALSSN